MTCKNEINLYFYSRIVLFIVSLFPDFLCTPLPELKHNYAQYCDTRYQGLDLMWYKLLGATNSSLGHDTCSQKIFSLEQSTE